MTVKNIWVFLNALSLYFDYNNRDLIKLLLFFLFVINVSTITENDIKIFLYRKKK